MSRSRFAENGREAAARKSIDEFARDALMDRMETTVDEPPWLRNGSWIGCPLIGAGLGWSVSAVAAWASGLHISFPFKPVLVALTDLPGPWAPVITVCAGAALGLVFAAAWARERLVVTVTAARVTLARGAKTRRIEADLAAVYRDGKELVLTTTDGREIAREKTDLDTADLAHAFTQHGHPWLDEPPPEH